LRRALEQPGCVVMPSVYDALGAKLVARSGAFECAFMSGYGVSLSRLGDPDVGLASFADVLDAGTHMCRAAGDVPMVGDGDTGFGGVANVRRTVLEFHRAGFAAVSIEDQVFPKRCAFAKGVRVVDRPDALARLRAALDARDEIRKNGGDILVIGRTDCRLATNVSDGFEEALWRCAAFEDMGADVVYFEAPRSEKEMETFNQRRSKARSMLAQVERGDEGGEDEKRTVLSAAQCGALGYDATLFGLTLLSASAAAMQSALEGMAYGAPESHPSAKETRAASLSFAELNDVAGFDAHRAFEARYDPDLFSEMAEETT
jgi:2-methylisocitrate lyase-like PEP mutase family enzyme